MPRKKKRQSSKPPSYNQRLLKHLKRIKSRKDQSRTLVKFVHSLPATIPGGRDRIPQGEPIGPLHPFRARIFQPGPLQYGDLATSGPKYHLGNVQFGSGQLRQLRSRN